MSSIVHTLQYNLLIDQHDIHFSHSHVLGLYDVMP